MRSCVLVEYPRVEKMAADDAAGDADSHEAVAALKGWRTLAGCGLKPGANANNPTGSEMTPQGDWRARSNDPLLATGDAASHLNVDVVTPPRTAATRAL